MAAIRFDQVSKRFTIHHERARSFQDLVIRRFRRDSGAEQFWALREVSFAIEPGASVGIVGTNGSGKSTLLKLMTRILNPTSGSVTVDGRVSALLELGAGFHPELSGRDNVFLNASILGMQRSEVARRFDDIVRFAGLERFIDIPVKHYSSGMYARLGFSVAVHVDPDILLIDEVLSVGDEGFQERCFAAIHRFHRLGRTLVLVSHDLGTIRDVCTEVIWLDRGSIRARGEPREVVSQYLVAAHTAGEAVDYRDEWLQDLASGAVDNEPPRRWGSGEAEILDVTIRDRCDTPVLAARSGEPISVCVRYRAHQRIERPVFGLGINVTNGMLVTGPNTRLSRFPIAVIEGEGTLTYVIEELLLLPGEYRISASIYDEECVHAYDYHDSVFPLTVVPGQHDERFGVLRLPAHWEHEPHQPLNDHDAGAPNGRRR
ncbi:MAG: lipopolysaccharide transport system ATP-binding protein [Chloroflexota bacterium]|jgi:lipopolysaccharide transport system ATP-binding protein|nr:lipopolysaccharide transport system ATP-binding protein [Chloroflexota bacterium]